MNKSTLHQLLKDSYNNEERAAIVKMALENGISEQDVSDVMAAVYKEFLTESEGYNPQDKPEYSATATKIHNRIKEDIKLLISKVREAKTEIEQDMLLPKLADRVKALHKMLMQSPIYAKANAHLAAQEMKIYMEMVKG